MAGSYCLKLIFSVPDASAIGAEMRSHPLVNFFGGKID